MDIFKKIKRGLNDEALRRGVMGNETATIYITVNKEDHEILQEGDPDNDLFNKWQYRYELDDVQGNEYTYICSYSESDFIDTHDTELIKTVLGKAFGFTPQEIKRHLRRDDFCLYEAYEYVEAVEAWLYSEWEDYKNEPGDTLEDVYFNLYGVNNSDELYQSIIDGHFNKAASLWGVWFVLEVIL